MSDACRACGAPLADTAAFCGSCGQPRPGGVAFLLRYYLAMLAVGIVALIYARVTDRIFETTVLATIALGIVTLGFAIPHRALVLPAYRRTGFGPLGFALVIAAAPVVCAIVLGYVHGLGGLFGIHVPGELEGIDTHGLAIAVLLIAVAPPLEEELGFRGLIYGTMRKSFTLAETFLISSFAFALLHFSVPALLTHLPLGLYFCWLRHRSGSLWPPIVAHACHNLGVIIAERAGWG